MATGVTCESLNSDFDFFTNFQHVISFLEKQKELMDAHMVDFFISAHWETLLPRKIREDLELLSPQQLGSLPTACNHESGEITDSFGENLKHFLVEATKAQLKSFPWLREGREFSSDRKVNFISHIMTPKKSHEVEVMSDVVNSLATQFLVSKILDLGSGKGYLSQYLALQYGLKVIGVDSSDSNTQNASKRNERLLKAWQGLVKKSQNDKVEHISNNIPGGAKMSTQRILDSSSKQTCACSYNVGYNSIKTHSVRQNYANSDNKDGLYTGQREVFGEAGRMLSSHSKQLLDLKKPLLKEEFPALSSQSSNQNSSNESSSSLSEQCNKVVQNKCTCAGTEPQDACCSRTIQTGQEASASFSNSNQPQTATSNSFLPVTGFVDQSFIANGELRKLFDQLALSDEGCFSETNGMFLVGLHSCGDLVPVALRIFVSQPSVKLICIVGCCYHLVSQEFGSDGTRTHCTSDEPGFPMSQFLKPFRLHVSRNATMVAQQAAERIASESKFPPPSVLYRAILQVILKEKFGLDGRGLHVGKAGSKCTGFKEYVHKCLAKLGLGDRICELSDEELESYHERFKSKEKQLHAFHQLRATIAPCIESVFLLDRLCYLHEQGFKSASIVKLFDPVKSPRCYAIIASKT